MKPLTAEEIAELRGLEARATPAPWRSTLTGRRDRKVLVLAGDEELFGDTDEGDCFISTRDLEFLAVARNALPRLLDEVERSRGTDHPEIEPANYGATALDTLNLAPFTPGGRFLYPRAYNQIHAELKRSRALLKRIEWAAEGRRCPACHGLFDRWADGDTIEVTQEEEQHGFGHRPDCALAALLGAA